MSENSKPACPRCGGEHLHSHKKGFNGLLAFFGILLMSFIGAVITPSIFVLIGFYSDLTIFALIGALAGTIEMNEIKLFCTSCGHSFYPKKAVVTTAEGKPLPLAKEPTNWLNVIILIAIMILAVLILKQVTGYK